MAHTISTPANVTRKTANTAMEFQWAPNFGPRASSAFDRVQIFIDTEVLRFCDARTPVQTHQMRLSAHWGSRIGSGIINYLAPYSSKQYYNTPPSRPYDALRGAFWFERGKIDEKSRILSQCGQMFKRYF